MRANTDLRVILADAIERPRRCAGKCNDGMIADAAVEDIAEKDDRLSGPGESDGNAAALARVVARDRCRFQSAAGPIGPGECQRCARVGFVLGFNGRNVALVDPGCKGTAVQIERHRFEPLTWRI